MDSETSEQWVSNIPRQSIGEIKSIEAIIDGITNKDEWNIYDDVDSNPSVSHVYKSRNQMEQFYSNHKTTEPSDWAISMRWDSTKSDFEKFSHKFYSKEEIFSSFDYNKFETRSNWINSKKRTTNLFDSWYGSLKSQVPQHLIMDANRRQRESLKLSWIESQNGILKSRKLGKQSIEAINKRFDYYASSKKEKLKKKEEEKKLIEEKEIEILNRKRIGSMNSTFTPEL